MGIELRTQQPPPDSADKSIADTPAHPPTFATAALPQTAEEKPRRRLPEWLRLGKDEEPVPLPITASDESPPAANSVAGPVEEFQ